LNLGAPQYQKGSLKGLNKQVPADTYETRLKDTVLLQITDLAARIGVPSGAALLWLERRMYGQISNAMKGVLGKHLDLQFVTAP
jgi:chromosomal replication initiation ATPase DnaA